MSLPAPLSVLHEYGLIDMTDDALIPPDLGSAPDRLDGEDEEAFLVRAKDYAERAAKVGEEWRNRFEIATETGKWDGLLAEGKTPTVFRVRQVPLTAWDAFKRAVRQMGEDEIKTLAFRLGVVGIENLNLGVKVERGPYLGDDGRKERTFGDVLSEDVPNAIAQAPKGKDVVHRIGLAIMRQRGAPLGKS
jgi:hypothetical protein